MELSKNTQHWIAPNALTIGLNFEGMPDYIQVSVLANAVILSYIEGVINYDQSHNYRKWYISAFNTKLSSAAPYYVYARLQKEGTTALIVYDTVARNIYGATDVDPEYKDENYYFVYLGKISSNYDETTLESKARVWEDGLHYGMLSTPESPYQSIQVENNLSLSETASIMFGKACLKYDAKNKALYTEYENGDPLSFYATGGVSAKGYSGSEGGGGGGASALYGLNDVLKNAAGDGVEGAAVGRVLMFNGTHWYAGDAKGKVTAIKIGSESYKPDDDGVIALPEAAGKLKNALTIRKNGVTVDSFDGSVAKSIDITVPTKVSELTNDSKFLLASNLVQGANIAITTDAATGNVTIAGTYSYTHPTGGANTTITAATGRVLSAITVNGLGHVTSVGYKALAESDIPSLSMAKISGLQSSLDGKLNASVFNDLFEKVLLTDGVTYAIRAKYGFYSDSFVSAKGANSESGGGGGGGISSIKVNGEQIMPSSEGVLELPDYPTIPTSLKNPFAITIKANGSALAIYDGSEAKEVNLTYTNVGAAAATHTHEQYYDSTLSRTANTVLAAPNGSAGKATFRTLVAADIPALDWSKITSGKPTTLTGYGITDGVNNYGYSGSGNAITAASISGHKITFTKGETFLKKATFDDLFEKVLLTDGVTYAIRAKYGFYSDSFVSAKGANSESGGGGGGGIGSIYVGTEQYNADSEGIVHLPAYPTVPTSMKNPFAITLNVNGTAYSYDGSSAQSVTVNYNTVGAAAATHTHTKSQITDFPTSLKNPNALIIQANGSEVGNYDGSSEVTVKLTYSNIGAAAASHTHTKSQITDFPTSMKNPNALSLNINGTAYSYDGSSAQSVSINYSTVGAAAASHTHNFIKAIACNSTNNSKSWNDATVDELKLKVWDVYQDGGPTEYGNILEINSIYAHWKPQLWFDGYTGQMRVRNKSYNVSSFNDWRIILDSVNYNSYAPTKTGSGASGTWEISVTGNAATATKLLNAQTIWGQSFNGTAPVSGAMSGVTSISSSSGFYLYPHSSATSSYYLKWTGDNMPFTLNTIGTIAFSSTLGGYSFWYNTGININENNISGTYLKLLNRSSNPLLQLIDGGSNWYVQATSSYMYLGSTSTASLRISASGETYTPSNIYAAGGITAKSSSSDIRLKTDIEEYDALSIVTRHRSVKYHWNEVAKRNSAVFRDNEWHFGLIAQELQREYPQLVKDVFGDYLTIDYERLIPVMWRAIQQLAHRNEELQKQINEERRIA